MALLLLVPIAFLITLVTTCTGTFFALDAIGLWPAQGNHVYVSGTSMVVSLVLGAFAAIAVSFLLIRLVLRFSRKSAAMRESNQ